MNDIVIVALITLAGTIISGVVGIVSANKVISVKLDELNKRVDILDRKIEIHNGYAEKFASITSDVKLIQKDVEYLKRN